ncbi:MAG: PilN domain-containing protein [Woeseiaceae bacterium]
MSQDINLLLTSSGVRSRNPTARHLGIAVLGLIVLGIGAGVWYDTRNDSLARRTSELNNRIDELISDLQERSQFLADRNADPALVAELQRREREADDKSRVMNLLSGKSVGNTAGFSDYLVAFGRRFPRGLWLDHIEIGDGGRQVLLSGRTLDAQLVPRFLTELRHEPVMAGTPFQILSMSEDEKGTGPLQFTLASACGDAGDAAQACVALADGEVQP